MSIKRRLRITAVAEEVSTVLQTLLDSIGVNARLILKHSSKRNSIYINVVTYAPDGGRLKGQGAAIRISDHRVPGARWVNFSRPARRFYGVWCFSPCRKITAKVARIGRHIADRIKYP